MCWFPNAWICNHVVLAACQTQYLIEPDQSIDPAHSHFPFPPSNYLSILPAKNFPLHIFNHPSCVLFPSAQHSNPGHAGPFPVASLHNANPTSPTSASMAGAHAHRSPVSPIISPIELIPSVTNPENLPCLPDIPPIQVCYLYISMIICKYIHDVCVTCIFQPVLASPVGRCRYEQLCESFVTLHHSDHAKSVSPPWHQLLTWVVNTVWIFR